MEDKYNLKNNKSVKKVLRIVGPIVLLVGIVLVGITIRDMFASFNSPPFTETGERRYHYAFIGMPFIFVGGVMTSFGFMGTVLRYQASQVAPIGKDVINYMLDNTKDSAGSFMNSVTSKGKENAVLHCVKCNHKVSREDKFCDECGVPLAKTCPNCMAISAQSAKFCKECGLSLR